MKKICLSLCLCLGLGTAIAQVDSQYDKGCIKKINGRVLFQDTIYTTLPVDDAFARTETWAQQRFTKPNVIVSKFVNNDINTHTINLTAEEYLVFTNRLFVLDRTRINYWVETPFVWANYLIKIGLLLVFLVYMVRTDLPLSTLPFIGKYVKRLNN